MTNKLLKLVTVLLLLVVSTLPNLAMAADTLVDSTAGSLRYTGGLSQVIIGDQNIYQFYLGAEGDLEMASSTNAGSTWVAGVTVDNVNTTDVANHAVWYDGWTPTSTEPRYIHISTVDNGLDDIYYTRYDVASNTFSTTVLATTQAATCTTNSGGQACTPTITKAVNGDLYMALQDGNDAFVVRCAAENDCTNTANWAETSTVITINEGNVILLPVAGSSTVFITARSNSTTVVIYGTYDPSTNVWATSTLAGYSASVTAEARYSMMSGAVSTSTGSTSIAILNAANDFVTQDHDIWYYEYSSTSGMVRKTDVATNVPGSLMSVKLTIDNSSTTNPVPYVMYMRRTCCTGAFVATSSNLYYRYSTTSGQTWSDEQGPINDTMGDFGGPYAGAISNERIGTAWQVASTSEIYYALVADLTPWTPGNGGGPPPSGGESFWFLGYLLPHLGQRRKRGML